MVLCESNGFQAVLKDLFDLWCQSNRLMPLPLFMRHHDEKKGVRIQRLDPYLNNQMIRLLRSDGNELLYEQTQMFPDKQWHDDGPDGLEMAIAGLLDISSKGLVVPEYERLIA
jgi:hypothetical protein